MLFHFENNITEVQVEALMMAIAAVVLHYLLGLAAGAGLLGMFMPVASYTIYLFTTVPHLYGHWRLQELLGNQRHLYYADPKCCFALPRAQHCLPHLVSDNVLCSKPDNAVSGSSDPVTTMAVYYKIHSFLGDVTLISTLTKKEMNIN